MHKHDYKYSQRIWQVEATNPHLRTSFSPIKAWANNEHAHCRVKRAGGS